MQMNFKKTSLATAMATALISTSAVAYEDLITQTPGEGWKGSLITEFIGYQADNYGEIELPGFLSAGHAHGFEEGVGIGHWELVLTGDINEHLTSRFVGAIFKTEEEGLTTELEEAWIQTKGLGNGLKFTGGRMYTELGYHTSKHNHEWDFADQPLIITGLFGSHPLMDGARMNWVAPTDQYLEFGFEVQDSDTFPSGGHAPGLVLSAKTGGDMGHSSSWQAGVGFYSAKDVKDRTAGHEHEGEYHEDRFSGDVKMANLNAIYKWAPNGNVKERNLTLQAEYFYKEEDGTLFHLHDNDAADPNNIPGYKDTLYTGKQTGYYAQAVYQFMPEWRVGYRYEQLSADNSLILIGSSNSSATLNVPTDIHGFVNDEKPTKQSVMLDWSPSHYSRLRLQFNRDESNPEVGVNNQWVVQYSQSFGSHGAHAY